MFLKNLLFKYGIIRLFFILGIFILLFAFVELGLDWFPDSMEIEACSADLTSDFKSDLDNKFVKNRFNLNDLSLYNEDKLEIGFTNSIIDSDNSVLFNNIALSDFRIQDNVAYETWELNEQSIPLNNFYNYFIITSNGKNSFLVDPSADIDNVRINLTVNGENQEFIKRENFTYFFRKNKDCKEIQNLKIEYITRINNNEKTSLKLIIEDFNKKTELKGFEVKNGYVDEQWVYLAVLDKTKSEKDIAKILNDILADKISSSNEKSEYQSLINKAYNFDEAAKIYILNKNLSMSDSFKTMDVFTKYKAFDPVKVDLFYDKIAILKSKNETLLNDASCDKDTIEAELKINGIKCVYDSVYYDKKNVYLIFNLNENLKKFINSTETSNLITARELILSVKSKILNYKKTDITKNISQRLLSVEKGENNVVEKWSLDFDRAILPSGLSDYITFKLNIPYFQSSIELTDDVTVDSAKFYLDIDGEKIVAASIVGEEVNFLTDKDIKESKDIHFIADFNRGYYENSILGFDSKIISMKNAMPKMASFIIYNKEYDSSIYKTSPYSQIYGVEIQKVVYDPQKLIIDMRSLGGATNDFMFVKSLKFSKNVRPVRKKLVKIIEGEELVKFLGLSTLDASDDFEKSVPYISRLGNGAESGYILQKNSSVLNNLFKENKNNIFLVIIGICVVLYFLSYPLMSKSIIPYFQKKSNLNIIVRSAAALIVLAASITAFATSQLTIRVELANTVKNGKVDVSYEKVKGFAKSTLKTEKVVTKNKMNFVEFNLPLSDVKRFALSTNVGPDASVYKNIALKIRYIKLKNFNSTKIQTDFTPKTIGSSYYLISNLDVKNWLSLMIILYLTISVFLSCYIFFLFDGIVGAVKDIGVKKESVQKVYEGVELGSSIKNLVSFLFIYGLALITINSVKFTPNKFVYYALFGILGIYLFGAFWLRIRSGILSVLKIEKFMIIKNTVVDFTNKNLVKNGFKLFLNAVVITIALYLYFTPNLLEDLGPIVLVLSGVILIFIDYDIIIKILKFLVKLIVVVIKFVMRIVGYIKCQIQGKPYEPVTESNRGDVIKKIENAFAKREINALYITLIAIVVVLSISPILKFLKDEKSFNTFLIIATIIFGILVFAFNRKKVGEIEAERAKELEEEKKREKEFDEKFKKFAPPEELSIWYNLKLLFKKFSSESDTENKENEKNGKE